MAVDPEIRRMAADPKVVAVIRMIDCVFEDIAERKDLAPVAAETTTEQLVEICWSMFKRGILRLRDEDDVDDDDDDPPLILEAVTAGQRARACRVGAKLFAVRQLLRRGGYRSPKPQTGQ
jgi:hypothetical protein